MFHIVLVSQGYHQQTAYIYTSMKDAVLLCQDLDSDSPKRGIAGKLSGSSGNEILSVASISFQS